MATSEKKPAAKKTTQKAEKKPVEREVVKVSEAKAETKTESGATVVKTDGKTGNAGGLRIGAVLLWLLAIAFEVLAILMLNGTINLGGGNIVSGEPSFLVKLFGDNAQRYSMIGAIVLDLVFVIIGSQLWKRANRIDPASEKNKLKFFLWNNMGLVAAVVAFVPLIVLVLKDKEMDPKSKKIVTVVAAIALVIAGLCSYDFNPVSQEDLAEAEQTAAAQNNGVCYWTQWGKSYHFDQNCQTLTRSKTLYEGTIEEAFEAKRTDPCDFCAGGADFQADAAA